jgi:TonB-linked SusC/RagA family outer membrane protein
MRKLIKLVLALIAITLLPAGIYAQTMVSGKITDAAGVALPGATVAIKGTNISVQTDATGSFSIKTPNNAAKLVVSYVGFASKTVSAENADINVVLQEDNSKLSEVVVTGLATSIKRTNAANAVASISAKQLYGATRPQTLDAAMQGKLAGANIVANTGAPGGGISVKLRGISSINGSSEPLYIIDGVFINNSQFQTGAGTNAFNGATGQTAGTQDQATNRISDINPADIENIEILKGPSAAAIYGTRANAGVIIITTKKGKAGKTSVSFGQDVGFAKALRFVDMHKTNWDLTTIRDGRSTLLGAQDVEDLYVASGSGAKTYDYERQVYGNTGFLRNTRLSVTGGTDKLRFYVAGNLTDEKGIQKKTGYSRNSIRLNVDYKPYSFIDFSVNSNYLNSNSDRSFSGNDNNGVSLGYSLSYLPNWLPQNKDSNGVYPENPFTGQNPLEIVDKAVNNEKTNRFIQSFSSNIQLFKNDNHSIKIALQGGVDYLLTESFVYIPDDVQFQQQRANPGAVRLTNNRNLNTNFQGFLVYNGVFDKLSLTSQLGAVRLSTDRKTDYIQGEGLIAKQTNPNNANVRSTFNFFSKWQDVGLVAQQEANFDDKIIATAGVRFDKSSLNSNYKKFYAFPKASIAVNIANFSFWNIAAVNAFKIRTAYGQTGGVPVFGDTYNSLGTTTIGGQLGSFAPSTLGYSDVKPETAQELEFGADFGILNNRVTLEATYYIKTIKDFLNPFSLSPGTGVTQFNAYPVGDFENKGIELGLNASIIRAKNIVWSTGINWWTNKSKVTRLIVPEFAVAPSGFGPFGTNRIRLGESPSRWYGTPVVNGLPTQYEDAQPKWQLSWSNNVTFLKNFDFSFVLHKSHKAFNSSINQELTDEGGNSPDWATKDKNGVYLGQARQLGADGITTRQFIVDASFTKLREVSLYYTIPKAVFSEKWSAAFESLKLGISANNVALWTSYFGYDPEASNFGNRPVGGGVDLLSFPSARRIFFHLNVNF